MVRIKQDLSGIFPGMPVPVANEDGYGIGCRTVGLRFDGRKVLAEDKSHREAYHRLTSEVVREIL